MWIRSVCMTAGVFAGPPSVGPLQFRSPPNPPGASFEPCETATRLPKIRGLPQTGALGVGLCSLFWALAVLRAADDRVLPAAGFSLSELDDANIDLDLAERMGLPVDAGRMGAYGPNVTVLRDFVRSSRQPV